ncbi:MAG: amidohydrolase [Maritimibacter sp.]|nr:amidohydrolase [Maritimibacter sp.]
MPIRNRLAEMQPEIAAWRHDLHENPELLYETHRTSAFVAEKLRDFGCDEVVEGIGRTGVVGLIHGRNGPGRTVGLRADMDALPIEEATGLPHASKTPGVMHACGHDGHTAMLLGAAKYLAQSRNFEGSVAVIFQPAEEGGAGGDAMVKDGLMERFDIAEVYGMHNSPGLPVGTFSIRPGPFYAAMDTFEVIVTGKGGHAAMPQKVVDTTVVAAQMLMALQTIAARNADPTKALVVSVTSFRTDSESFNVIPQVVTLRGTVRTFDAELRDLAEQRIAEICARTAAVFDATAEVDYRRGYPAMVNHEAETAIAAEVAAKVAGDVDTEAPAIMGGEDFAFMLEARPGAYIQIGNGDTASVHHPEYDFNDETIPAGCSFWVELVESRLPLAS